MPDEAFKRLGTPRRGTDELCSLCDQEISEEHIPLMLLGDEKMWVYCEKCEQVIIQIAPPRSAHE
jgi:hypothetical protein